MSRAAMSPRAFARGASLTRHPLLIQRQARAALADPASVSDSALRLAALIVATAEGRPARQGRRPQR